MSEGFAHPLGIGSDKYITQEETIELASNWFNHLMFFGVFLALFSPCLFG